MTWGVGGCVGALLGGVLGFGSFALLAAAWLGRTAARLYAKRRSGSDRLVAVVVWSNTLTWLLPVLGMVTAAASLALPRTGRAKRNVVLGWAGVFLSFASAMYGVMQNHMF